LSVDGSGGSRDGSPEEDTYTPAEAAKILRLSKRRVIQLITAGDLEAEKDVSGRWRIPQRAVHNRLGDRPPRPSQSVLETAQGAAELRDRIEDLSRELGRLEGRLELTGVAESTLREQLERERARADRLEEELREARKSWWRRVFGG